MHKGHDVAIVGAGALGGALAHALARRGLARSVRLIDRDASLAAGKALDIMQAAPIEGFTTRVSGAADPRSAAGAAVVVIADLAGGAEWQGDDGLQLLEQLSERSTATLLCSGASQCELVDRGVRELHLPRERLFGSAPEALAGAVRAIVALETHGSARDVALTVLGLPPAHIVVPWEEAAVGGLGATRVLDEPARRRVTARIAPLWPPGPYALAAAAAKVVDALLGRSHRLVSAFALQDDGGGRRTRAVALPVRVGPGGIVHIEEPLLRGRDRVVLDNAMLL